MKNILSIDGGGIRGIIPAMLLAHIEHTTQKSVSELFDLVVGTSTGGILACALTRSNIFQEGRVGNDNTAQSGDQFHAESITSDGEATSHFGAASAVGEPPGHGQADHLAQPTQAQARQKISTTPLYQARDLVELYRDRGRDVFTSSTWQRLTTLGGVLDELYNHEGLEAVLHHYLGESRLIDAITPTMVTAYDLERRKTIFFKSWRERFEDISCVQACRATSAAPTYFEPAVFELDGAERALIDGGVFINSPSVSAYAEAIKLFPGEDFQLLSLGTGELTRPLPIEDSRTWGKAGWLLPLLSCMFDGMADAADHQMTLFLGERYQRFQLNLVGASDDMDDASADNIERLQDLAHQLIKTESDRLNRVCEQLVID